MPGPTNRQAQVVDPLLTNLAREYHPLGFIADQVAPRVNVEKESGKYPTLALGEFARNDVNLLKPDRAETKEIELDFSTDSYLCEEYALKVSISDRERRNADNQLDLERRKLRQLMDRFQLAREVRVETALRSVTTNSTPSNNWNVDAATIEDDIVAALEASYDLTGITPNTLIVPWKVANAMAKQSDIREILKYTVNGQEILREGQNVLPAVLWGLKVVVGKPLSVTSQQGAAQATSPVWGDEVKLVYVDPSPAYESPSTIQTFQTQAPTVTRWRGNDPDVEYIRVSEIVHEKLVSPDTGYELRNLLS